MKALITGATAGIGRAITKLFCADGFDLALVARSASDLESLREELLETHSGRQIFIFPTDLGEKKAVKQLIHDLKDQWADLDVLINNAGLFLQGAMLTEDESQLEQMMAVNLFAPYYLSRGVLPMLTNREKAHIFNICSVASRKVFPNSGSYGITKYALLGFNGALREELKETSVRVTAVLPGATWSRSWEGAPMPEERLMQPDEIARSILAIWNLGPSAVVEEIVLRPQKGDL